MTESFAKCTPEEQYIIRKCVKALNKDKKQGTTGIMWFTGIAIFFIFAINILKNSDDGDTNTTVLIMLVVLVLYVLLAVSVRRSSTRNAHRRNMLVEQGLVDVTRATLVERDRFRSSGDSLYIMVETDEHVQKLIHVGRRQDDNCRSGLPCFLISYPGVAGVYDENDIVWKGMYTAVRDMPHGVV